MLTVSPYSFLQLSVQAPSHWAVGEPRNVKLRLVNAAHAELRQIELRLSWAAALPGQETWRRVGNLRAGGSWEQTESCPAPIRAGDEVLQVDLRCHLGPHLELELRSEKIPVQVRERTQSGAVHVDLRGAGVMGDNIGMGLEGGIFANQIHLHGSTAQPLEDWLHLDAVGTTLKELPLYLAHAVCQPWTNHHGLSLRGVPAGEFIMGAVKPADPLAEEHERPRRVTLTRACWMGQFPVTNEQYARVRGLPCPVTKPTHRGHDMPVACVSWAEAVAFCEELTLLERQAGVLPPGYEYRLPTEAEWECACRAGCEEPQYGKLEEIAALPLNQGGMGAVGRFLPNAWGLHDMLGLVFEWCQDAYAAYHPTATTDPLNAHAEAGQPVQRVIRGSCYDGPDDSARASARHATDAEKRSHRVGFRVVLAGA
jgi:formylglycine-generating enzyme